MHILLSTAGTYSVDILTPGTDGSKESASRMQAGRSSSSRQDIRTNWSHELTNPTNTDNGTKLCGGASLVQRRCTKICWALGEQPPPSIIIPPDPWPTVRLGSRGFGTGGRTTSKVRACMANRRLPTCGGESGAIQCTSFCKLLAVIALTLLLLAGAAHSASWIQAW